MCVGSAGEALAPALRDEWRRQTGLGIVNGYGASETLVLVLVSRGETEDFRPSPGVDITALNDTAAGVPTRLCIRTSTVALGYWDRPAAQSESFRDGAFCPADLFVRTDAGGWRFAGREDSLVKIRGRWVNLAELEGACRGRSEHPRSRGSVRGRQRWRRLGRLLLRPESECRGADRRRAAVLVETCRITSGRAGARRHDAAAHADRQADAPEAPELTERSSEAAESTDVVHRTHRPRGRGHALARARECAR
jgi:acyl-CoA synthetase (AMP-forming)/AMP-acid ligase II